MSNAAEHKQMLREDGTPYYVQLAAIIRRQIADDTWLVGDRLPTLKQMVASFGVSPMTVRHALAGLEKEGLISAERGRGTFVTAKPDMPPSVPYGLTRSPSHPGSELSFRVIASRPAEGELRIAPEDGEPLEHYRYMKRIFARHGAPFIVGEYLVADSAYRAIPENLWATQLISTLLYDTKAVGLTKVRQTFRVVSSMPQEAAELDIRVHDPVVRVRRIFQNARKEVICLAQLVYRTDGVVFDINIDIDDRNRLLELGGFPES
ncbi:GntR family transcriptional regulator [Mesorhizobium microcysteis]|uniref:GntR family transcriptional regulator n=1 Tax=Neoaquamicrobium microcysteis TaxID=2682781 RepID=A0A5D4GRZ0_9HYPH|nr:GntR family transcriptional regulator [Mesorhizobium microcysteis]TYR31591.1 GntR family transcriptional regulator [Mesorhizobium microcysteis]